MLFFMGAASHYTSLVGQGSRGAFWIVAILVIAAVELNALIGTQGATKKPLDSVSGALWSGFILTGIFYVLVLGLLS